LRWIRIERAALYMTHTAYSAAYISNICYFSNPSHMSRIFTKYTGESPGVFREGRKAWMKRNQVKRSINLDINV
jgi:AraC-like DNA-binding protein